MGEPNQFQCFSIVGSGEFVSHLWRLTNNEEETAYGFNIGTQDESLCCKPMLHPGQLLPLLRLLRVVCHELIYDGAVVADDRNLLPEMACQLDRLVLSLNEGCFKTKDSGSQVGEVSQDAR